MKKIQCAPAVDLSMSSLDPEGIRRVQVWFDYLKRWDNDESVRKNSLLLTGLNGVYVLKTTTDIRIFFRVDGDTITVLDIAKQSAIVASGTVGIGGSADVTLTSGERQER